MAWPGLRGQLWPGVQWNPWVLEQHGLLPLSAEAESSDFGGLTTTHFSSLEAAVGKALMAGGLCQWQTL